MSLSVSLLGSPYSGAFHRSGGPAPVRAPDSPSHSPEPDSPALSLGEGEVSAFSPGGSSGFSGERVAFRAKTSKQTVREIEENAQASLVPCVEEARRLLRLYSDDFSALSEHFDGSSGSSFRLSDLAGMSDAEICGELKILHHLAELYFSEKSARPLPRLDREKLKELGSLIQSFDRIYRRRSVQLRLEGAPLAPGAVQPSPLSSLLSSFSTRSSPNFPRVRSDGRVDEVRLLEIIDQLQDRNENAQTVLIKARRARSGLVGKKLDCTLRQLEAVQRSDSLARRSLVFGQLSSILGFSVASLLVPLTGGLSYIMLAGFAVAALHFVDSSLVLATLARTGSLEKAHEASLFRLSSKFLADAFGCSREGCEKYLRYGSMCLQAALLVADIKALLMRGGSPAVVERGKAFFDQICERMARSGVPGRFVSALEALPHASGLCSEATGSFLTIQASAAHANSLRAQCESLKLKREMMRQDFFSSELRYWVEGLASSTQGMKKSVASMLNSNIDAERKVAAWQ